MPDKKEYVVTLKNKHDLDDFYCDMEHQHQGGKGCTPGRSVGCKHKRPRSRNTHYLLTDSEAEELRNDPRVLAVERTPADLGLKVTPQYEQTETTWDKSASQGTNQKNWGLLRVVNGAQTANWGSDGTATVSGTIKVTSSGRNVDVVIVDGHMNPDHPEYAANSDGTGGTRVIQYNWLQHNPAVTGGLAGTYVYTPYVDGGNAARTDDNNHGSHVAGTVAGNTQGWARDANIYNISPYGTNPNSIDALFLFDYIREFHANKSINPETGRKNPTVTNHSWGYTVTLDLASITDVFYQGVNNTGPFTAGQLTNFGILNTGTDTYLTPYRYTALDADMQDAIDEGIIIIGSAGNSYHKIDVSGGVDYNNYFVWSASAVPYHRGMSPASADNVICVGAISTAVAETKSNFSNCGPRVDIYAPGSDIMSSLNSGSVSDPRNASYDLGKYSGTSMASPQVCGIVTCLLEQYPNFNQADVLEYLQHYAKSSQMGDTGGSYSDFTSLQGSDNNYLFYFKERPVDGHTHPKLNNRIRPNSGMVYPRNKIRR